MLNTFFLGFFPNIVLIFVDILAGNVGFFNNYNLCHIRTLNWEEILSGQSARTIYVYNFTQPERACMFV